MTLNEITNFWFNNKQLWFNSSNNNDLIIKNKFNHIFVNSINNTVNTVNNTNLLANILLYDQISRHIYRDNGNQIKYNDNIAYKYALSLVII